MTTREFLTRPPVAVAIWPAVAFAAFAIAGLRATIFAVGHAGPTPTFQEILSMVDWSGAVWGAIVWSAPAGLLALAQARWERLAVARSPITSGIIAILALAAAWYAFQMGPGFQASL